MNAITCERICHTRPGTEPGVPSRVREFSATFQPGELVGVCGPDGCGKGLLLNIVGMLEKPDSGRLELLGHNTADFSDEEATTFRNEMCGFLFGHPYLLPSFTVAENVAMPLFRICGNEAASARQRTLEVLEFAGICGLEMPLAGKLAPDLCWRAAFARALVHEPQILIAISTPPADLLPLARRAADDYGLTILWAGEREALAPFASRIITMKHGLAREQRP